MTTAPPYPKIELHVHLEATLQPARLLELARRNGVAAPSDTVGRRSARRARFADFGHFIDAWIATSSLLRGGRDFQRLVVDYARRGGAAGLRLRRGHLLAGRAGAPGRLLAGGLRRLLRRRPGGARARPVWRCGSRPRSRATSPSTKGKRWHAGRSATAIGVSSRSVSAARRTPSHRRRSARVRRSPVRAAWARCRTPARSPDRRRFARRSRPWRRTACATACAPSRTRRCSTEIAARGIVCDVTPISNLRTGVVATLGEHPLPRMLAAGVACSISSDDPALMDTDLSRDCAAAIELGHTPRAMFEAGVRGALCDGGDEGAAREVLDDLRVVTRPTAPRSTGRSTRAAGRPSVARSSVRRRRSRQPIPRCRLRRLDVPGGVDGTVLDDVVAGASARRACAASPRAGSRWCRSSRRRHRGGTRSRRRRWRRRSP